LHSVALRAARISRCYRQRAVLSPLSGHAAPAGADKHSLARRASCPPEAAGMVAPVVVGKPEGAGTLPFDYFKAKVGTVDWLAVPWPCSGFFPGLEGILHKRHVRGDTIIG
jgi:hypothetical protein